MLSNVVFRNIPDESKYTQVFVWHSLLKFTNKGSLKPIRFRLPSNNKMRPLQKSQNVRAANARPAPLKNVLPKHRSRGLCKIPIFGTFLRNALLERLKIFQYSLRVLRCRCFELCSNPGFCKGLKPYRFPSHFAIKDRFAAMPCTPTARAAPLRPN